MNVKHFLSKLRSQFHDQRGVTLMELILVLALMTLVFGGIVSLLTSMYGSYEQTSIASDNQREATMIINQLAQDIRKSVSVEEEEQKYTIRTDKQGTGTLQTVEYRNENGQILYYTADSTELLLAESGQVTVEKLDSETETKHQYQLTVVTGSGNGQATMTTQVAPYDWSGERR